MTSNHTIPYRNALNLSLSTIILFSLISTAQANENSSASAGCGHINVFDVAPRQQHLYGAHLLNIDGQLAGPSGATNYRISAGTHRLEVTEHIDSRQLSINDIQRNKTPSKTLSVDIAPNTTYYLAARLNTDKRTEWKDGAYWDPIIWKQSVETCR